MPVVRDNPLLKTSPSNVLLTFQGELEAALLKQKEGHTDSMQRFVKEVNEYFTHFMQLEQSEKRKYETVLADIEQTLIDQLEEYFPVDFLTREEKKEFGVTDLVNATVDAKLNCIIHAVTTKWGAVANSLELPQKIELLQFINGYLESVKSQNGINIRLEGFEYSARFTIKKPFQIVLDGTTKIEVQLDDDSLRFFSELVAYECLEKEMKRVRDQGLTNFSQLFLTLNPDMDINTQYRLLEKQVSVILHNPLEDEKFQKQNEKFLFEQIKMFIDKCTAVSGPKLEHLRKLKNQLTANFLQEYFSNAYIKDKIKTINDGFKAYKTLESWEKNLLVHDLCLLAEEQLKAGGFTQIELSPKLELFDEVYFAIHNQLEIKVEKEINGVNHKLTITFTKDQIFEKFGQKVVKEKLADYFNNKILDQARSQSRITASPATRSGSRSDSRQELLPPERSISPFL